MFIILFTVALMVITIIQANDLHTSVVLLKEHSPESRINRTTETIYNIVDAIKSVKR